MSITPLFVTASLTMKVPVPPDFRIVPAFVIVSAVGLALVGTWLASRTCLPHLLKARTPHILNLAPPLNLHPHWFGPHTAYTIAKYNMSLVVLGLAEELKGRVAVNALWPQTTIATAAVWNRAGQDMVRQSRKPEIMAEAAHAILTKGLDFTGRFLIDEQVLRDAGVRDFTAYACAPGEALRRDLFLDA